MTDINTLSRAELAALVVETLASTGSYRVGSCLERQGLLKQDAIKKTSWLGALRAAVQE